MVYNPRIIQKYQYSSNYLSIPVKTTKDWCFYTKNGYIDKVAIGGQDCYQMVGISYWTEKDGRQLGTDLAKVFQQPDGKQRYWDQVPLEDCKKHYKVAVRPCQSTDVVEIDTFQELQAIDPTYVVKA